MRRTLKSDRNRNMEFQKHKNKYLKRTKKVVTSWTKYETELIKKKQKELGFKESYKFIHYCVMKQIEDLYDQDEVDAWHHIFDDYEGGYDGRHWTQVPY